MATNHVFRSSNLCRLIFIDETISVLVTNVFIMRIFLWEYSNILLIGVKEILIHVNVPIDKNIKILAREMFVD